MKRPLLCALLAVAVAATAALWGAGCGGSGWPSVVSSRDVPAAGGAPRVTRVRDLGLLLQAPDSGKLPADDMDGEFVVGEYVLVEGSDFGKLPTILIGGRPAKVLARTSGGGIVTQIPTGVPAGQIAVEVSQPRGKHALEIPVRRYALVAQGDADRLYVVDVQPKDAVVLPRSLEVQNPRQIRYASDGALAYVASGIARGAEGAADATGKLSVVSMVAKGGPRVVHEVKVANRFVVGLAVADRAPLLAVVGERRLQLFSLREPGTPAPYAALQLADEIVRAKVVAADLDARGRLLALLLADGNKVALYDVSRPEAPELVHTIEVLPNERLPLVRDMSFAVDGETLWVVSGDNALSIGAGHEPTRLTALKVHEGEGGAWTIEVARTTAIPGATAPLRLAVARGQPVASGTTVRRAPEKAAVFVTAVDAKLFQLGGLDLFKPETRQRAVSLLKPIAEPGMLVRTDAEGGGGPLFSVPTVLSSVDLSPDSQVLLATTARLDVQGDSGLSIEFGLTVTPLWGQPKPRYVKLGEMTPGAFVPPFGVGNVRIQP